jgi:hypothetical protein
MSELPATRRALHALAEHVLAPLRVQETGHEIALEVRPGGFATPPLPGGGWAGVVGTDVVRGDADGAEHAVAARSLRQAAAHVGLRAAHGLPDEPLALDPALAGQVAAAHATGAAALVLLRERHPDATPAVLWPEHFDIAVELGDEAAGRRVTAGVSPGDEHHDAPYAYLAPWGADAADPRWDATGFTGKEAPVTSAEDLLAFWEHHLP